MREDTGCHFVHEIAKKHGWDNRIMVQLIKDAGIEGISRKRTASGKYSRYLNDKEYQRVEAFIKKPIYKNKNSINSEYWRTPLFLRIN